MNHSVYGLVASFVEVDDSGWARHDKLLKSNVDQRLPSLDFRGKAWTDMEIARDCYVLGLFHACFIFACKALEEDLAVEYYKWARDEFGREEAERKLEHLGLPKELFCWARGRGLLPIRNQDEEDFLNGIVWLRSWGAHSDLVMDWKILRWMQEGQKLSREMDLIRSKQVAIPEYVEWIAQASNLKIDANKPSLRQLLTDEAALKVLLFVLDLLERMHQGEPRSFFGPG